MIEQQPPYKPPYYPSKLATAEGTDVKYRDIATFVLLMVVTLGIYWFYVAYQWARELNGLMGQPKYQPLVVLLVNIITCGIAGLVFECLYALDIAQVCRSRGISERMEQLGAAVLACNIAAAILSIIPFGILIGIPAGIMASVFVQMELNKLAGTQGLLGQIPDEYKRPSSI